MKGTWLGISYNSHWLTLALVVYRRKQPILRSLHQRPILTHITETMELGLSSIALKKFHGSVVVALPEQNFDVYQVPGSVDLSQEEATHRCQEFLTEQGYADQNEWVWDARTNQDHWLMYVTHQDTMQLVRLSLGRLSRHLVMVTTTAETNHLKSQAMSLIDQSQTSIIANAPQEQSIYAVALALLGSQEQHRRSHGYH